ncbi:MAG: hypothetical protein ACQEWA_03990, partial [Sphaerochaetaceae bacterium]
MKYRLYHDESKNAGYWHGMLLVPEDRKSELVGLLELVRNNLNYDDPIGIKNVKKEKNRVFDLAQAWIEIGCGALRSRSKGEAFPVFLGQTEKGRKIPETPEIPTGCKFIVLRDTSEHKQLSSFSDFGSKIETFIRVGLKGGLHLLGSNESPIHVHSLHFDGHEHYGRKLSKERIIDRMNDLRDYCSVSGEIDDRTSDHRKDHSQERSDCQLIQLTDLLVGSFRTCIEQTRECHETLCKYPNQLTRAYQKGYKRMQNSRWKDSLSFSEARLDDQGWHFSNIDFKKDSRQLELL